MQLLQKGGRGRAIDYWAKNCQEKFVATPEGGLRKRREKKNISIDHTPDREYIYLMLYALQTRNCDFLLAQFVRSFSYRRSSSQLRVCRK
jgi:hypothetical protein